MANSSILAKFCSALVFCSLELTTSNIALLAILDAGTTANPLPNKTAEAVTSSAPSK